jgi:hypothetical protein
MALTAKSLDQVRANVPVAAAASDELVRVNFDAPKNLRDHWKVLAVREGKSLRALIEDAMNSKYPKE